MERTGGAGADNGLTLEHYKPSTSRAASPRLASGLLVLVACLLVAVRLPSLAQPMGADQGLYAYVGERILHGDRPYIDAWDQKPPAIHYTYALMRALWASDGIVPAADIAAAAAVAILLFLIGRDLASRGVGASAALLFLLLSNPAFTRLNGVRVRAQCETFIALAVAAGLYALVRRGGASLWPYAASGLFFGVAFAFKYNAAIYAAVAVAGLLAARSLTWRRAAAFVGGTAIAPVVFLLLLSPALVQLYEATIEYNLRYSGETYSGPLHFLGYLVTFPIDRARDDALWTLGGAGCAVLLAGSVRSRACLIPVAWVAGACLSIAINGSRGLPQYFVQAAPGLALAAAWAGWILFTSAARSFSPRTARLAVVTAAAVIAIAAWRVNQFPKLVEQTAFDANHLLGRTPRDVYLARYADPRKYSALGARQVADFMEAHTAPGSPVYVFGFTGAAYVYAGRPSASRFFWSRPVIAGFNAGRPDYGAAGVLADLERARPGVVALQLHDWAPDVDDSAHYFLTTPPLAEWLRANYRQASGPEGFDVWLRRE